MVDRGGSWPGLCRFRGAAWPARLDRGGYPLGVNEQARVVVVGGGVIGLCIAERALHEGFEVVVVERGGPGGDGCSEANAGMVVPSHFIPLAAPGVVGQGLRWMLDRRSPFYVRPRPDPALLHWGWLFLRHANARHVAASRGLLRDLSLASRQRFLELAAEEEFGLETRGLLMLCRTTHALDEEARVAAAATELGLAAEVLDAAATAALEPSLTLDVRGAVHFPQDCHLDPARFLTAMRERVRRAGGEVLGGVDIDRIERADGRVAAVCAGGRRFAGGQFVLAAGAWSTALARGLGLRLPMQPGKGYSLTLPGPPQLPRTCMILTEARVAVTPLGGRLRFAGTMEIGGPAGVIDAQRVAGLIHSIPPYLPAFRADCFAGLRPWAGLRPVSPDGLPFLGRVPGADNVIVATGHAMLGLSLAPVTGLLVGELLAGRPPSLPIAQLAVNRFARASH